MGFLPPGPLYLCRLTLRNLPTSILWYIIFRLIVRRIGVPAPTWLAIAVASLTQVVYRFGVSRWRVHRARRDAAARGAVMVPDVQESGLAIINAIVKNMTSDYPG